MAAATEQHERQLSAALVSYLYYVDYIRDKYPQNFHLFDSIYADWCLQQARLSNSFLIFMLQWLKLAKRITHFIVNRYRSLIRLALLYDVVEQLEPLKTQFEERFLLALHSVDHFSRLLFARDIDMVDEELIKEALDGLEAERERNKGVDVFVKLPYMFFRMESMNFWSNPGFLRIAYYNTYFFNAKALLEAVVVDGAPLFERLKSQLVPRKSMAGLTVELHTRHRRLMRQLIAELSLFNAENLTFDAWRDEFAELLTRATLVEIDTSLPTMETIDMPMATSVFGVFLAQETRAKSLLPPIPTTGPRASSPLQEEEEEESRPTSKRTEVDTHEQQQQQRRLDRPRRLQQCIGVV